MRAYIFDAFSDRSKVFFLNSSTPLRYQMARPLSRNFLISLVKYASHKQNKKILVSTQKLAQTRDGYRNLGKGEG